MRACVCVCVCVCKTVQYLNPGAIMFTTLFHSFLFWVSAYSFVLRRLFGLFPAVRFHSSPSGCLSLYPFYSPYAGCASDTTGFGEENRLFRYKYKKIFLFQTNFNFLLYIVFKT